MKNKITFPVVLIKNGDPAIYFFSSKSLGLISKGGEKFYKSGSLFDSNGNCFNVNGSCKPFPANFWASLRYFQKMWRVELNIELIETIKLDAFKKIIVNHIEKYNKYWKKRDLLPNLFSQIMQIDNFSELIYLLR
jgi:hypothetical protein